MDNIDKLTEIQLSLSKTSNPIDYLDTVLERARIKVLINKDTDWFPMPDKENT